MIDFFVSFSLKSLVKGPTCFKSKDGRCIDLILTNRPLSFKNSGSFETGISDYHLLIYSMFKSCFKKAPAQIIEYTSFKRFVREDFRSDLQDRIGSDFANFESFSNTFESV